MLSVIIRTRNGENVLLDVLRPLVAAAAEGMVRDVVFLDMGSVDGTAQIADAAGATFLAGKAAANPTDLALAEASRGPWVLMLDQATVLSAGWLDETLSFVERQERVTTQRGRLSAVFRPEHEPEIGSADVRRRASVLLSNRVFSVGKLSQGVLVRRTDLTSKDAPTIQWAAQDPSISLPNLLRLRSRTHLAQPMVPPATKDEVGQEQARLSRAAL
jgi:hypothetical protein